MLRHPFPSLSLRARLARGVIRARRRGNNLSLLEWKVAHSEQGLGFDLANALARDGKHQPTKWHSKRDANIVATQIQVHGLQF
jgi:hypothetical protein